VKQRPEKLDLFTIFKNCEIVNLQFSLKTATGLLLEHLLYDV